MKQTPKYFSKRLLCILLTLSILAGACMCGMTGVSAASLPSTNEKHGYRIISYITQWNWPGTYNPLTDEAVAEVDATKMTHINYAFGIIDMTNSIITVPDPGKLRALVALKQQNPNLKILLSVGGWGMDGFANIAADDVKRAVFARSCKQVMDEYGLDGIDLDWEYPGTTGDQYDRTTSKGAVADGLNYIKLLKDCREAVSWDKLLTIASGVGYDWLLSVSCAEIPQLLDFINIMDYDLYGAWTDHSDYNCNLYPANNNLSVSFVCKRLAEKGYPKDIMNVGVPFYGRDRVLGKGDASWLTYAQISELIEKGCTTSYDPKIGASLMKGTVDGRTYDVTYDEVTDIKDKMQWIIDNGYGGAMYWEYSQDGGAGGHRLRDTVYNSLKGKTAPALTKRYHLDNGYKYFESQKDFEGDAGKEVFFFQGGLYSRIGYGYLYGIGWTYNTPLDTTRWNYLGPAENDQGVERNEFNKKPAEINEKALKVKVTPNAVSVKPGTAVTFQANASGGSGAYEYGFEIAKSEVKYNIDGYYKEHKVHKNAASYGSTNTFTNTFTEEGTYWVYTLAKDATGQIVGVYSSPIEVTNDVEQSPISSVTVKCNPANTSERNIPVSCAAIPVGGDGIIQYTFKVYNGTKLIKTSKTSASSLFTFTPAEPGDYTVTVTATDSKKTVTGTSDKLTVTMPAPLSITLKASADKIKQGEYITWNADVQGGASFGTQEYKFDLYRDGCLIREGSFEKTLTYTCAATISGNYTVKLTVKDSGGETASKISAVVTAEDPYKPLVISKIQTTGNQTPGSKITFIAATEGGTGHYRYTYYIMDTKGQIHYTAVNVASNSFSYTPSAKGTYVVKVYVEDTMKKKTSSSIQLIIA